MPDLNSAIRSMPIQVHPSSAPGSRIEKAQPIALAAKDLRCEFNDGANEHESAGRTRETQQPRVNVCGTTLSIRENSNASVGPDENYEPHHAAEEQKPSINTVEHRVRPLLVIRTRLS